MSQPTSSAGDAVVPDVGRRQHRRARRVLNVQPVTSANPPPPRTVVEQESDDAYYDSYAQTAVHEDLIKDRILTETYRKAIFQNQDRIAGKVVLDVGCGTGILSIFCAQAGARRVYAVEASDISDQAKKIMMENNLSETVIVLCGQVEDVEINEKVDVIVSDWMGYMLLYEGMLGSVITARDRWLKPGGLLIPSHATLYMAPVTCPERYAETIDFWRDVYGINMSAMIPIVELQEFVDPCIETITGENLLTRRPHAVKRIDCSTVRADELEIVSSAFMLKSMLRAPFHGFAFWFDVEFRGPLPPVDVNDPQMDTGEDECLVLSTAPEDPPTHWEQTLIYFSKPKEVEQDHVFDGCVTLRQFITNFRRLSIDIDYKHDGIDHYRQTVL